MPQLLCRISDIGKNGKEVCLRTGTKPVYIMLFRRAESVHAFLNVCPHKGQSLNTAPDQFLFNPEQQLVCAHHGASFQLETGECLDGPCKGDFLRALDITLDNDTVWLENISL